MCRHAITQNIAARDEIRLYDDRLPLLNLIETSGQVNGLEGHFADVLLPNDRNPRALVGRKRVPGCGDRSQGSAEALYQGAASHTQAAPSDLDFLSITSFQRKRRVPFSVQFTHRDTLLSRTPLDVPNRLHRTKCSKHLRTTQTTQMEEDLKAPSDARRSAFYTRQIEGPASTPRALAVELRGPPPGPGRAQP